MEISKTQLENYTEIMDVGENLKFIIGNHYLQGICLDYPDKGIFDGRTIFVELVKVVNTSVLKDDVWVKETKTYATARAGFTSFPAFNAAVICRGVRKYSSSQMVQDFSKIFIKAKENLAAKLGYYHMFCTVNNSNTVGIINAYKSGYKCIDLPLWYKDQVDGQPNQVSLWHKQIREL